MTLRRGTPLRRTPLTRGPGPKRRKRGVGRPKYLRKEWRALRAAVLERDQGRCQLGHPRCTGEATTVHHLAYNRGRGVKRLLVSPNLLLSACWSCHKVEDPHLGEGFGLGSRDRNARREQPTAFLDAA